MGLRINDVVPNFTAETDQGTITFHDWIGDSWAILFSHPKDFTPVCTTEFGAVAQLAQGSWELYAELVGALLHQVAVDIGLFEIPGLGPHADQLAQGIGAADAGAQKAVVVVRELDAVSYDPDGEGEGEGGDLLPEGRGAEGVR